MTSKQRLRLSLYTIALIAFFACSGRESYDHERTPAQKELYKALNDSMQHMVPHALDDIRQAMHDAKDSLTWYDYYLMYGRHYLLSQSPDSLLPYAERTLDFVARAERQTPRTNGLAAMANSLIASYHYLLYHNTDSVLTLYQHAYDLMMQSDLKENLPDLCANMADAYIQKGDLPKASRWYRRALVLVDSLGLPTSNDLTLYMGLGRIYTSLRDFEHAKQYYEMADTMFDAMKPNMQSYFLNNYGNYYYYHREYEEALKMFKRLKAHIEKYNAEENFDMYLCKINMADVYLNLNELDSAKQYVKEAEDYFTRQGVDVAIYYAHTIQIGIAIKEGQFIDVHNILMLEKRLNVNDANIVGIRDQYMDQFYAAVGDFRSAYEWLQAGKAKIDSTDSRLLNMRSEDIMTQLTEDTIRLHHQLAIKERETAYAHTRTAFWIILTTLIIALLLVMLWLFYEHKRRLQNQLDMLMLRLSTTRQRISPHFVFNVLNSRASQTNQQEADQLLNLAKLIRKNLDMTSRNNTTLAEELDFVSQYVALERQLMGEDFEFQLNTPERSVLEGIMVPSTLVQIITENAIIHGIKPINGEKRLIINVTVDEENTRIEVVDNGKGFDIRHISNERLRTGFGIIRGTVNAINQENRKVKMRFDVYNDHGCHATLTIPRNIILL